VHPERVDVRLLRWAQAVGQLVVQLSHECLVGHCVTGAFGAEGNGETEHLDVFGIRLESPRTSSSGEGVEKGG
jgi:hypothetical protein